MIIHSMIRALLEENSVTISGFGTFSIKKNSAKIKDDIIFPPQNTIDFVEDKNIEGFDFVSKLSKWEQIRMDEAQTKTAEWVSLLENGLDHNKTIFFDDFGTFSKDSSGSILFQSMLNPQLNVENEGFEPVPVISKSRKEIYQNIETPVQDTETGVSKKSKKRDIFWFIFTISATIIVLGILFLKDNLYDLYQTAFTKNENYLPAEDTIEDNISYISHLEDEGTEEQASTENHKIDKNLMGNESENREAKNTFSRQSDSNYIPYQEGKYYVIAGSFKNEESALRHIKQKQLEQYHAKLLVNPQNQRLRVCIGIFDNEKDAINFAAQMDKNYWVLK